nr:DNA replication/repair protein RecF [Marivibrio halodurans]
MANNSEGGVGSHRAAIVPAAVTRLRLTDFRNYTAAGLEPSGRPVVLTGPNGAGKTNLLEAVSLLAPGRGLRGVQVSEPDRRPAASAETRTASDVDGGGSEHGARKPWAIAARVAGPAGTVDIGTGRDPEAERRLVRVDGHPARNQQALAEHVAVVWLTPQMDRLFLDGGGARRRFLDRLILGFDPAHAGRVGAYEQAMRQRARLLKERGPGGADARWLDALEVQMVERGVAIAAARRDMADRLDRACRQAEGPFPAARVGLAGDLDDWLDGGSALAAEERFQERLRAARPRDAEAGGAGVGPHRSDLMVRHAAKGLPADQCSTGEQKALLIAIVLAHARLSGAETGTGPILLLDEVAAHLDGERRGALYRRLLDLGLQAWVTGTDRAIFEGLEGRADFFRVEAAAIRPDAAAR